MHCAVQYLGGWFVDETDVGLKEVDEPEKSKKLRKLLCLFLRAQNSTDMDSIDL